jgi:hypothetical protein
MTLPSVVTASVLNLGELPTGELIASGNWDPSAAPSQSIYRLRSSGVGVVRRSPGIFALLVTASRPR